MLTTTGLWRTTDIKNLQNGLYKPLRVTREKGRELREFATGASRPDIRGEGLGKASGMDEMDMWGMKDECGSAGWSEQKQMFQREGSVSEERPRWNKERVHHAKQTEQKY